MAAPELSGFSKHPKDLPFSPLLFLPSPEGRPAPHPHPNLPFAEPRGDSGLSPVPSQPEVKCRQKANHRRRGQALAGGWPGPEPACLTPGQGCGKAGDEDQPEDRDGCGQAPPRGGGDRSCLRSREPAATFHGKNVFRPPPHPEARGPQPMTQASAAATELLPRQPGSVRGQSLSPAPARPVPAGTPSRLRPQPRALALGARPAQATSSETQLSPARWGGSLGMASAWALGAHGGCPGETLKGRPCVGPRGPELPRPLLCSQQTPAV